VKRLSLPQGIRDDRGSVMVVVALAMTALLSMVALAVDIGMLFSARGEAQRVADAAALAGAGSFMQTWNGPAAEEAARNVAIEYGSLNTVRDEGVVILPEDVEIDMATHRVTVTVRRSADRGSAIATWFARVFGVEEVDVAARATAEAAPAGAAICLKPFTLPDAWDDEDDDGVYDPGEEYSPSETGYGSDWRDGEPSHNGIDPNGTIYDSDYGRPLLVKEGDAKQTLVSSWYFPWDVPQVDGQPHVGADRYRWNIENCNTSVVQLGEEYMFENGGMQGPTKQGIEGLIAKDKDAEWDVDADSVVGSSYRPWKASPRVVKIPLFDPTRKLEPGKKPIVFNNFTDFFIEGMQGKDVIGRFLYASGIGVGSTGTGGAEEGPLLKYVHLVE
jgi:Flp pilus assembly protein TadG